MKLVRNSTGFTLIELMIVVVIVGILASIAYPSYSQYVIRANRSEAQQFMLHVSSVQAQFMLDSRTYGASLAALGMSTPSEVADNYTITVAANNGASPPTYTITATAINGQVSDGNLVLNSIGTKTPANKWE